MSDARFAPLVQPLESLTAPPDQLGYNAYLATLLQSVASAEPAPTAPPQKPAKPADEGDRTSVKSAGSSSTGTTAESTPAGKKEPEAAKPLRAALERLEAAKMEAVRQAVTKPGSFEDVLRAALKKLSPYEATVVALRTLPSTPAITQAILSLKVHAHAEMQGVASAIFEDAVQRPDRTVLAADLVLGLSPFMVTCFAPDGNAVTLLGEVTSRCEQSVATVTKEPSPTSFGAGLLLALLCERRLVPLAAMKALFAKLLFADPKKPPSEPAVTLACHMLLTCFPALHATPAGAQMAQYVCLRLQELAKTAGAYSAGTVAAIAAVAGAQVPAGGAPKAAPPAPARKTRRGGAKR